MNVLVRPAKWWAMIIKRHSHLRPDPIPPSSCFFLSFFKVLMESRVFPYRYQGKKWRDKCATQTLKSGLETVSKQPWAWLLFLIQSHANNQSIWRPDHQLHRFSGGYLQSRPTSVSERRFRIRTRFFFQSNVVSYDWKEGKKFTKCKQTSQNISRGQFNVQ